MAEYISNHILTHDGANLIANATASDKIIFKRALARQDYVTDSVLAESTIASFNATVTGSVSDPYMSVWRIQVPGSNPPEYEDLNVATIAAVFKNQPQSTIIKTVAITAIKESEPTNEVIFAAQSESPEPNNIAIYLPSEDQPESSVQVTFNIAISSDKIGEQQSVDPPDPTYPTLSVFNNLAKRVVTTETANSPIIEKVGDDQDIYGIKTFKNDLKVSTNILPVATSTVDIGSSLSRFNTLYSTELNNSGNITVSGNANITGNLTVSGNASIVNDLTLDGAKNLYVYCSEDAKGIRFTYDTSDENAYSYITGEKLSADPNTAKLNFGFKTNSNAFIITNTYNESADTFITLPSSTDKWELGSDTYKLKNVYVTTLYGNLTGNVTGNLTGNVIGSVTGNVTGTADNANNAYKLSSASDNYYLTITNNGYIIPSTNDYFDLGNNSTQFLSLHTNKVYATTIYGNSNNYVEFANGIKTDNITKYSQTSISFDSPVTLTSATCGTGTTNTQINSTSIKSDALHCNNVYVYSDSKISFNSPVSFTSATCGTSNRNTQMLSYGIEADTIYCNNISTYTNSSSISLKKSIIKSSSSDVDIGSTSASGKIDNIYAKNIYGTLKGLANQLYSSADIGGVYLLCADISGGSTGESLSRGELLDFEIATLHNLYIARFYGSSQTNLNLTYNSSQTVSGTFRILNSLYVESSASHYKYLILAVRTA